MTRDLKILLTILCFLRQADVIKAQGCVASDTVGNAATDRSEDTTTAAHYQFLVSNPITCHGVVESWEFWNNGPPSPCLDMTFQIWRPSVGTSNYTLVGNNRYTCTAAAAGGAPVTFTPPGIEQIPVQPGDVYGWWTDIGATGNKGRVLSYDTPSTGSAEFHQTRILPNTTCARTSPKDFCMWNDSSARTEIRGYSLRLNLNQRPKPNITNLPANTTLYENLPVGTFVYKVEGFNSFNYNDVLDPDMTYAIVSNMGSNTECTSTDFAIDGSTGVITIADTVSFEDYQAPAYTCTMDIEVTEGPNTVADTLTLNIIDVNEPHTITSLPDTVTVSAYGTAANTTVHNLIFTEPDTGSGQPAKVEKIVYSNPPNAPLVLNGNGDPIRTNQDLYYWSGPDRFVVGVIIQDGIHSAGPAELTFIITDLREPPDIVNLDHTVTIPENSAALTDLFTVEAWPVPDGRGNTSRGTISYRISAIYPLNTTVDTFIIDSNIGTISHKANPQFDFLGTNPYNVEIEAVYIGPPDLTSDRRNLTVELTHVNQAPYHRPIGLAFITNIKEKEPVGNSLPSVKLDATDRDLVMGDWIHYTLSGAQSSLFRADNVTNLVYVIGDVILASGLDSDTYVLDLHVVDSHGESDTTTITIHVRDINDNSPVFAGDPYTGFIKEDAPGGSTTTVVVTATDYDGPPNGDIRFSVVEPIPDMYFQVDPVTLAVTNKQPIPYEVYHNMTFTIVATDGGDPELNDTATVFIEIQESNTHDPTFSPTFYSLDLRTDTPEGAVVHTVQADDLDSDSVQDMTYYWLIIDDYYDLGRSSGEIYIRRELVPGRKHVLYVAAQDNYGTNNNHHSHPYTLRVDTYKPESTLVDIYLDIPLVDFLPRQANFLAVLNNAVPQWDMRIESVRLDGQQTVVRVYAVESDLPDQKGNENMDKVFIDEDAVVKLLREKLKGTPSDILKAPEFAPWKPVEVQPAYPVWIIDTPGGVAFLAILCALFLAAVVTMFVLLAKKFRWCCYKNTAPKIKKTKVEPYDSDKKQFKLNYLRDGDTPYHISDNASFGRTYNSNPSPSPTIPIRQTPPPEYRERSARKSRPDISDQKNSTRMSMDEKDPDHHMPPVQDPEPNWRLPPRSKGAETTA